MSNTQNEDKLIKEMLTQFKTIAVVGLSPDPDKPSFEVARYLQSKGYKIIPVRPGTDQILGEKAYASLSEIPVPVDIVDVFRKVEFIPEIIDEAIRVKAKVVWMQLGLVHPQASEKAKAAGLKVVMDRCLLIEHRRLL
ncbi:MAG: CoA-binding protein [Deltaproteobacteria bacterium]|nr:CoA-binding protein [Deltaproteobacteria bacterium]